MVMGNTEMKPVGIIGLGYVGLPLLLTFYEHCKEVIGVDIDENKIKKLEQGISYLKTVPDERIQAAMTFTDARHQTMLVTSDMEHLKKCGTIIICVPTPLNAHREPDLSFVDATSLSSAMNVVDFDGSESDNSHWGFFSKVRSSTILSPVFASSRRMRTPMIDFASKLFRAIPISLGGYLP